MRATQRLPSAVSMVTGLDISDSFPNRRGSSAGEDNHSDSGPNRKGVPTIIFDPADILYDFSYLRTVFLCVGAPLPLPIPGQTKVPGTPDSVGRRRSATVDTHFPVLAAGARLAARGGNPPATVGRRAEARVPGLVARAAGDAAGGPAAAVGSRETACAPLAPRLEARLARAQARCLACRDQAAGDALTVVPPEGVPLTRRHVREGRRLAIRWYACLTTAGPGFGHGCVGHAARSAIACRAGASVSGTSSM